MPRQRRVPPLSVSRLARLVLGLAMFGALAMGVPRPVAAQPVSDVISGLYANEADPRATIKLLLAPSEKDGRPVGRVWGVLSFKDPRAKTDTCTFEFQSTVKSDVITCRDAMNPGCRIVLRLVEGAVVLDAAPECLAVYCKGQGLIPQGVYARAIPKRAKKKSHRP
jgi:hypothetical protein